MANPDNPAGKPYAFIKYFSQPGYSYKQNVYIKHCFPTRKTDEIATRLNRMSYYHH